MKTFETKEFIKELDRMGVVYTIDSNPSPEKIEKIKKSIEKRDERLRQMREDYRSGKFDDVIKSLKNN
jgi:predicted DNA-binding transcriptional regulator